VRSCVALGAEPLARCSARLFHKVFGQALHLLSILAAWSAIRSGASTWFFGISWPTHEAGVGRVALRGSEAGLRQQDDAIGPRHLDLSLFLMFVHCWVSSARRLDFVVEMADVATMACPSILAHVPMRITSLGCRCGDENSADRDIFEQHHFHSRHRRLSAQFGSPVTFHSVHRRAQRNARPLATSP